MSRPAALCSRVVDPRPGRPSRRAPLMFKPSGRVVRKLGSAPFDDGAVCAGAGTPAAPRGQARAAPESTYRQILKSSALIGSSSILNLAIGMVRMKAMAVLLGPAGFGLMG